MCNIPKNPDDLNNPLACLGHLMKHVQTLQLVATQHSPMWATPPLSSSYPVGLNKYRMFAGAVFNGPVHFISLQALTCEM